MSQPDFVAQFSSMKALLYSFAFRLTRDESEAQDLLQETAYKAYKYRGLYQPHTNLRAWLMTIMRNTFINNYRKRKRRQTLNDQTDNHFLLNSGQRTVVNEGEASMTIQEIQEMVEKVEEWARVPFLMYYRGYKYEEIAQELDIPLGTVKSRIFFARRQLKDMIRQAYRAYSPEDLI